MSDKDDICRLIINEHLLDVDGLDSAAPPHWGVPRGARLHNLVRRWRLSMPQKSTTMVCLDDGSFPDMGYISKGSFWGPLDIASLEVTNLKLIPSAPHIAMASTIPSAAPTLEETHSGVPTRLTTQAQRAKELLFSRRTKPEKTSSTGRKVQLPPYTTQEKFDEAIIKLKAAVGDQWVHVNDGALVDGWYMEHPYVALPLHSLLCRLTSSWQQYS